jgi:hypothetical protein
MPNKHSDAQRHHIPKMTFKVTNWSTYEAGLRRRGSLTLWVSDTAIAAWRAAPRKARYKRILGDHLHARKLPGQQAEAAIGIAILNRMMDAGRPDSVRIA